MPINLKSLAGIPTRNPDHNPKRTFALDGSAMVPLIVVGILHRIGIQYIVSQPANQKALPFPTWDFQFCVCKTTF